ncbi:MAG: serine hydrolase [Bacteroidetes bacterium]|nr:serine hydrolase [Bacteroidota bacterium]
MHLFCNASPAFFDVLSQPEKYKYQIVFTQIDRNRSGVPTLTHHYFHYNSGAAGYLYPASLVKLPLSVLALQKIQSLDKYGISPFTPMVTDSGFWCQTRTSRDFTQRDSMPSVEAYIHKMMLVSDNESYNRVYEFLGYDYIGRNLQKHGFPQYRIIQRYEQPCDSISHYVTNPVYFLKGRDTLYKQRQQEGIMRLRNPNGEVWMGESYYDNTGYLFPFSRSFIFNNFAPLHEQQLVLASVFTPHALPASMRWKVSDENLNVLKKYMGMWPFESKYPSYALPNSFKKYLLMGNGAALPDSSDIRSFNVVGRAFGVIADCAYIVDFKNDVEFMVSAELYCNENGILNDNVYEYDTVGIPFLVELGRILYQHEKSRPRNPWHNAELENLYK